MENDMGQTNTQPRSCDVAVVGAGPYGISAAAHLRQRGELDVHVFGDPMSFWRDMPRGMLLRSAWDASNIAFLSGPLSLEAYQADTGKSFGPPVPLEDFVEYGQWVQERAVPDVDRRKVAHVERSGEGFLVTADDGEQLSARRVVVAAGIESFANRPEQFRDLSQDVVTHSSQHSDLAVFAGQNVLVVGGGQSALESAALLHEGGARVEVIMRRPSLTWLHGGIYQRKLGRFKPLFYAPTDVGPLGMSRLLAVPEAFRLFPRGAQEKMARRAIRPAGAKWLQTRLVDVPITTGRSVRAARNGNGVEVELDDGTTRRGDHVILGTGYRVDVRGYDFLDEQLVSEIKAVNGYPVLGRGLESSVPGLHFMGAPAAWSFGPLMRFVSGTWWAGRSLARSISP
jgi:lysine/ornithine N-monooxygenase